MKPGCLFCSGAECRACTNEPRQPGFRCEQHDPTERHYGMLPLVGRAATPTEPLARPLKRETESRIVIELDPSGATGLADAFEIVARLLRKNGRVVILDE